MLFTEGVECFDGLTQQPFLLKVIVLTWSGDTPGISKLMCLTGHNSYMGCRYCDLKGVYSNHIYYPTTPPRNMQSDFYDPTNLPLRTHRDYKNRIKKLGKMSISKKRQELCSELGKYLIKLNFLIFLYFRFIN